MSGPARAPSAVVGIATHNRAAELRKALESAQAQSHRPLRVTVVDDASTDETPLLQNDFASVDWQRWGTGQGHVRARNHMMLSAGEDYFVSLDDDAWFMQGDEIAVAVNYLESHPGVAAVAYDIISPDRPDPVPRGRRRSVPMFIGCGHMLRLSIAKALDGYSEFPGAYGAEEKDLCLRLIDAGYAVHQLDGVHVWHDKSSTARDLRRQFRSGVCNDLTLALRRMPLPLLLPVLSWKVTAHLVFAIRHGWLRPYGEGVQDFLRAGVATWRGRRPVRLHSVSVFRALSKSPRAGSGLNSGGRR